MMVTENELCLASEALPESVERLDVLPGGGGVDGLAVRVNLIGEGLEKTQTLLGSAATEAQEILREAFEQIGNLHYRLSRIESALGISPPDADAQACAEDGESYGGACTEQFSGGGAPEPTSSSRRRSRVNRPPAEADEDESAEARTREYEYPETERVVHGESGVDGRADDIIAGPEPTPPHSGRQERAHDCIM